MSQILLLGRLSFLSHALSPLSCLHCALMVPAAFPLLPCSPSSLPHRSTSGGPDLRRKKQDPPAPSLAGRRPTLCVDGRRIANPNFNQDSSPGPQWLAAESPPFSSLLFNLYDDEGSECHGGPRPPLLAQEKGWMSGPPPNCLYLLLCACPGPLLFQKFVFSVCPSQFLASPLLITPPEHNARWVV